MRIAVVGSGISGLVAAYHLHRQHDIRVFEANSYIGGHTNTVPVTIQGRTWPIDTGFIVFNEETYPNFIQLMDKIGVDSQLTQMSFGVRCESTGWEYASTSLNSLFAQRLNLFRPSFHRMVRDIFRFFREAPDQLKVGASDLTLGEYLQAGGYSAEFIEQHLLPLGAAVWSTDARNMERYPARFFIQFFNNHGFLRKRGRSKWRTIRGGSSAYIAPLIRNFRDRIELNRPVRNIYRNPEGVDFVMSDGTRERFDLLILAVHSNQTLRLLADPSPSEREILSAIPYQENEVILHTDTRVLPVNPRAWACWNYHVPREPKPELSGRPTITYNMNLLQRLRASETFCVTLNQTERINPEKILGRYVYHHPQFTPDAVNAQQRWAEINGVRRTYFCGAYWRWGFHEDGVVSGLRVVEAIGKEAGSCKVASTKAGFATAAPNQ